MCRRSFLFIAVIASIAVPIAPAVAQTGAQTEAQTGSPTADESPHPVLAAHVPIIVPARIATLKEDAASAAACAAPTEEPGRFARDPSGGSFTFSEEHTASGCGEIQWTLDPPVGASSATLRFAMDRLIDDRLGPAERKDGVLQQLHTYSGDEATVTDLFAPDDPSAATREFVIGLQPGRSAIGWYFEDRGQVDGGGVGDAGVSARALRATVQHPVITYAAVPVAMGDPQIVSRDQNATTAVTTTAVHLTPPRQIAGQEVTFNVEASAAHALVAVRLPDGRSITPCVETGPGSTAAVAWTEAGALAGPRQMVFERQTAVPPPVGPTEIDTSWFAFSLAAAPIAPLGWALHGAERYRRHVDEPSRRRRFWWLGVVVFFLAAYLTTLGQAIMVVGATAWTTYPVSDSALLIHLQFFGLFVGATSAALLVRGSVERINERRLALAEAGRSHVRQILDSAPDAMMVVDSHGTITMANRQAEVVFAAPRTELVGRSIEALIGAETGGPGSRIGDYFQMRETHALVDGQAVEARRADDSVFRADISLSPIETASGAAIVVSVKDLSAALEAAREREQMLADLSRANQEMEDLVAELARSNEDLARFATVASHDLQEPLRKVTSYVTLLENRYTDLLDERGRTYIGFASDGARRMQGLIKDLLAYSRVGQGERPMEQVDLAAVVQENLADLEPVLDATGAIVEVGPLPTIRGRAIEVHLLVHNLLSNALKFVHPERTPRVNVYAQPKDGGWVVSVEDNGIGIDPEHHGRIFEVFHRLHPRHRYEGTGVGLALCRRILESHGGQIDVMSAPDEGAVFSLHWPHAPE